MKYKAGDFLARPHSIKLKITLAYDSAVQPTYALMNPRDNSVKWFTEYELDAMQFALDTPPDFEYWDKNLAEGDLIALSDDEPKPTIVKVVARIGDMVLISNTPQIQQVATTEKLIAQLGELGEEADAPTQQLIETTQEFIQEKFVPDDEFKKVLTTAGAQKSVFGRDWMPVSIIAQMNWVLYKE